MMDSFDKAVAFVLEVEGGYVNNRANRGGETNFGISKRAYPWLDIRALGVEEAKEIYRHDYWLPGGCDRLAWPLCLVHFDAAVNLGIGQAGRMLRNLQVQTAAAYISAREDFYKSIVQAGSNAAFLSGWLNRLRRLNNYIGQHQEVTNG